MSDVAKEYQINIVGSAEAIAFATRNICLIYILDGTCVVRFPQTRIGLGKSDIFLVNHAESPNLEVTDGSLAAVISIDYYQLCDTLNLSSARFRVNSSEESGGKYRHLRSLIQNLLLAHVGSASSDALLEQGYYCLLAHDLAESFREIGHENTGGEEGDTQAAKVIRYIHANYNHELSLNEIAEKLFLSPSWVSRLFQKATGETFVSYVKRIRLDYVKRDLEETDLPIMQVAMGNGFSTPSILNRSFKAEFGITPSEYREQFNRNRKEKAQSPVEAKVLLQILQEDQRLSNSSPEKPNVVRADLVNMLPWERSRKLLLNAGPAHILSSAAMQKQVLFLAHKLDIEYLRVWNLFSSRLMICGEGENNYNFTFIDEIMDFCVDNRLKLFFDLAQRKDVAMASEKREIYSTETQTIFQNAAAWENALKAFLIHIRKRYHEKIVGDWIFEFSFFLIDKPYYECDNYRTRDVWERGYRLVKTYIPSARVAGPGLICSPDQEFTKVVIDYLLSSRHAPDIFTTIHFPYSLDSNEDSNNVYQMEYQKLPSRSFLRDQIELVQQQLAKNGFEGELWVTEWGCSVANRNYLQDSCFRSAFIVANTLQNVGRVDSMGIFYASDALNVFSDSHTILSGSAGLVSRNGICKPAYYAYRFLNRLGRYQLIQTDGCVITAENTSDIRILCYNDKALGPNYYLSEENSFHPDELRKLFTDLDARIMELILNVGADESPYIVRQQILNEQKGSILDKWIDFDCSPNLTRNDMEYLEKISIPEIIAETIRPLAGQLRISFKMEPNEIRLITLTKE